MRIARKLTFEYDQMRFSAKPMELNYLCTCVNQIKTLTYPTNTIIVDNSSTFKRFVQCFKVNIKFH